MSPGYDGAPTPANAGATNRQNLNSANGTRLGPPCGCPRRGEHEEPCQVGQPIAMPLCSGRCRSFGRQEQERIGELYGACPCTIREAS